MVVELQPGDIMRRPSDTPSDNPHILGMWCEEDGCILFARPLDLAKVRAAIHAHEDACIGLREGLSLGADAVARCSTQVLRSRSALLALLGIDSEGA